MVRWTSFLTLLLLTLNTLAEQEDTLASLRAAEALVEETSDAMIALIEESKSCAKEDPERFYAAVESLLNPLVDFPRFAKSVMGATYYNKATPDQRARFAAGVKRELVRSYALALTEFKIDTLAVIPGTQAPKLPDRVFVRQEARTSVGEVHKLHYSMARSPEGAWKVRNIIIDGVNRGVSDRNQFLSIARDSRYGGDLDKVIDRFIELYAVEAADPVEEEQASPAATRQ
jgi:phospholipid transport system substrate-binding protein